ncbi:MAG TPA: hypothetical protein VKE24_04960 [Candidatus Acidoferrales bacterium]|nr:hypothetical protein [Candidatus Acidoferrales bacterium]
MGPVGTSSRLLLAAAALCVTTFLAQAQSAVDELQQQFQRENDAIRKVKILSKLGDAQFDRLHRETDEGKFAEALQTIAEYRDEVRTAEAALKASGADPERKPGGFKQLQIHLRKGLREISQTILLVPVEQRERFEAISSELAHINRELIDLLFPRQPGKNSPKEKPKE